MPAPTHPIDWQKVASLLEEQFPDFIRSDGPNLVAFMKAYYEWMDLEDNPNYSLRNLRQWRDIDRTLDQFVDWFHGEFMIRIPKNTLADRRLLIKHIQEFYRAKGTQQSYRLLFRILYNEEIDFFNPGKDLFRYNFAKWVIDKSLRTRRLVNEEFVFSCIEKEIIGLGSGARSRIESINKNINQTTGAIDYELFISKTVGTWQEGEQITCEGVTFAEITVGGIVTGEGRYLKSVGWNSVEKYHDSNFWQEYSYVVRSGQPVSRYAEIVKQLVHPAGTKLFGEVVINIIFGSTTPLTTFNVEGISLLLDTIAFAEANIPELELGLGGNEATNAQILVALVLSLLAGIDADSTVIAESILNSLAGDTRIANTDLLSDWEDYPAQNFFSWTPETFINGRGGVGTSTNWLVDLAGKNTLHIIDGNGVEANAVHMLVATDSANTMLIGPAYLPTSSANLFIQPY